MTTRRHNRCALKLEQLESREVPAGVVLLKATSAAGKFTSLTLIGDGDAAGNQVRVEVAEDNHLRFRGLSGTMIRRDGDSFSTDALNLSTNFIGLTDPNNGTVKLTVNFGAGPDLLQYDAPDRRLGDVVINLGAGDDAVTAKNFFARSVTINSTAAAKNQSDNDSIIIAAGGSADFGMGPEASGGGISKGLTIDTKNGQDTVQLGVTVGTDVLVKMTDGADSVTVRGSRIGGAVAFGDTATALTQPNTFKLIENSQVGGLVSAGSQVNPLLATVDLTTVASGIGFAGPADASGSTYQVTNSVTGLGILIVDGKGSSSLNLSSVLLGSGMQLTMGAGGNVDDRIESVIAGGKVTASYGAGNDSLTISNSYFHDAVSVTNTDGVDAIAINNCSVAKDLIYNGGNNGTNGPGDRFTTVVVGGAFKYTGGNGADSVTVNDGRFGAGASFALGDGSNFLNLKNSLMQANLSITSGKNADTVNLSGVLVFGTTTITTSSGEDSVSISGLSRFKRQATIDTGADNDSVSIACAVNEEINFLAGLRVTTGTGVDNFPIGVAGGKIWVLNGYTDDFDTAKDTGDIGDLLIEV